MPFLTFIIYKISPYFQALKAKNIYREEISFISFYKKEKKIKEKKNTYVKNIKNEKKT